QESNLDSCKLYKLEIENKYKDIENYAHFLQNMQKIDKLTEEEINQFLENKIIFSFCDIGFKTNESQKNFYPQLYKIYKSIKDNKN
ncbi:hypothetical protein EWV05_06665, partial [Campylobacter jejuni]|nr:hypothetical protein [Campylobacter jejuni]